MRARRASLWLGDAFRFVGALFYWNARKSSYVARGRSGRCPCQNHSDDSIPGRVRCNAAAHWSEPRRFQKICPLLIETPAGWRCSVHASQVRPFWGRAFAWCGSAVLIAYLLGAAAVFGFLRFGTGVRVSPAQVFWPPKWGEVRRVQSQMFFARAIHAFGQGRLAEAFLHLTSAQQRDPANLDAAVMLAQITMFQGSFLVADENFARLLRIAGEHRVRVAVTYHDALLSMDRMDRLAEFSLEMAREDEARAPVWVRSALLAIRAMAAKDLARVRTKVAAELPALSPAARRLVEAEFALRAGSLVEAIAALRASRPAAAPHPAYLRAQTLRLAELGEGGEAQALLDYHGASLGEFDQQLVQFELSATLRDRLGAEAAFRRLLTLPLAPAGVERIATALIAHPDAKRFRELSARVQREAALVAATDGAALWITGLVCGAADEAARWQVLGRQGQLVRYPRIATVDFRSRDLRVPESVPHLAHTLSLPREVIAALVARMVPQDEAKPMHHGGD